MLSTTTLNTIQPSYIREILKAASESNIISFAGGLPDKASFPMNLMESAFQNLLKKPELFQYSQTIGYQPLLDKLKVTYDVSSVNDLMVTSGSQQGLDLIARGFVEPGDKILVESPCYLGATQVFELAQAELLTLDCIDDEMDFEKMECLLSKNNVKFFYFVADFQNPKGTCYRLEVRKKIAELCKQYCVTLIEDAPYRELRFEGEDLPLVSSYYPENAIILRSFSKIVSPGLRIATIEASKSIINVLVKLKQITDLHSNVPSQFVILQLLDNPLFYSHLENVKNNYKYKKTLMIEQLEKELPTQVRVKNVEGGMFLWVDIKAENFIDMLLLAEQSLSIGVAIVPGQVFRLGLDNDQPNFRLNFSHSTPDEIVLGISKLATVIKQAIRIV